MGRELELKYRATDAQMAAIQAFYTGPWQETAMATTYYDTPQGDLSRRKWTLRHRLEGQRHVCTLKMPQGRDERREFETECASIQEAVEELCKLSQSRELALLAQEGLVEVCGARFLRCTVLLEGQIELALDRGVLLGGGRELPLQEVEAELKDGPDSVLTAFGAQLEERFHLEKEEKSKFRRALSLAKGE